MRKLLQYRSLPIARNDILELPLVLPASPFGNTCLRPPILLSNKNPGAQWLVAAPLARLPLINNVAEPTLTIQQSFGGNRLSAGALRQYLSSFAKNFGAAVS